MRTTSLTLSPVTTTPMNNLTSSTVTVTLGFSGSPGANSNGVSLPTFGVVVKVEEGNSLTSCVSHFTADSIIDKARLRTIRIDKMRINIRRTWSGRDFGGFGGSRQFA